MTTWEKWNTEVAVPTFMYSESIFVNDEGLIVSLENKSQTKKVTFNFKEGFLSVRETYDGAFMKTLLDLYAYCDSEVPEYQNLLKAKNSDYLEWFNQQSLWQYDLGKVEHYIILAYDVVYEVISFSEPIINIKDRD